MTRSLSWMKERLSRRGKYLIWEAEDEVYLLMHLRMTGNLLYTDDARFARVKMKLDDGGVVTFVQLRPTAAVLETRVATPARAPTIQQPAV